jgi:peptide/nickel transport system permease protein
MYRYVIRRAIAMVPILFGVSLVTYLMMYITPGDPAKLALRARDGIAPTDAEVEQFRRQQGLDDPIAVQYVDWLWGALHGDLGRSWVQDRPVSDLLVQRIPETVELAAAAVVIALAIALPAGIISAVHRGRMPDHLSQVGSLLGVSMPNFWLGYLLILVFALGIPVESLGVFPVTGAGTLHQLVLPAVTLGTGVAAIITRLLRSSMLEILDEAYIQAARSKGLRERIVVYKHALRNALIPVVTIAGLQLGFLLNGAVIVEIVFARPGLGKLVVDSLFQRDYPVMQGSTLLIAIMFVLLNFLVDVTYRYVDPRIDLGGGRP